MPIGIQRLNARHLQPTPHIIFITPLPGPSAAQAEEFLSRVAAICHPVMKANHLSVMSLEEYEPNPEFIGRNFNAGEVIQLVLKSRSGDWMSFRSVVMVMMHELAHCRQMNHSRAFWSVRNQFSGEMRELWTKGYTGEGIWGKGRSVGSGDFDHARPLLQADIPRNLCGGMYRSRRGKKRKRGSGEAKGVKESYAERQQRRIAKKFGVNGVTLGDDESTRVKLEGDRLVKGKPRVAGSARGRELRAAAAVARFDQVKEEEVKKEDVSDTDSDGELDGDNDSTEPAIDLDGSRLLDGKGHNMIKVCEEEDLDDFNVKEEMQELQNINKIPYTSTEDIAIPKLEADPRKEWKRKGSDDTRPVSRAVPNSKLPSSIAGNSAVQHGLLLNPQIECPVCTLANDPSAVLCNACSHVLDTKRSQGYWSCLGESCKESQYINAADCGRCGMCGKLRSGSS